MKIYKNNSAKAGPTTETDFSELHHSLNGNWNETSHINVCSVTRNAWKRGEMWVKPGSKVTKKNHICFSEGEILGKGPWWFYEVAV